MFFNERLDHFNSAERQVSPPEPVSVCMATVCEWQHIKGNHLGKIIAKKKAPVIKINQVKGRVKAAIYLLQAG